MEAKLTTLTNVDVSIDRSNLGHRSKPARYALIEYSKRQPAIETGLTAK